MQNNKPIWFEEDKTTFANPDTYQTIKHNKVESNVLEINLDQKPSAKIMVCTPCHSEVSMHYTQAVLKFQLECMKRNILISFSLLKSSLSYTRKKFMCSRVFKSCG
jgi:hypothetical protein